MYFKPCTVRDFMNYLKYIEHTAENLQFFLWYRDYSARFSQLPESEQQLSPEWTKARIESEAVGAQKRTKRLNPQVAAVFKDTDFAEGGAKTIEERKDPFNTPPKTPSLSDGRELGTDYASSYGDDRTLASTTQQVNRADEAFDDAGMKWKPCMFIVNIAVSLLTLLICLIVTTQPYRDEISRVITVYIVDGAPRQLNLSDRERTSLLHALQHTTHPSAFQNVLTTVEYTLRRQAHPNFVRWTICNGNRPRVVFARGLGISLILVGVIAEILITVSSASRAWNVLPILAFMIGISTLIAAWKGMCVVLHGLHHRHLRPWEMFVDAEDAELDEKQSSMDSLGSHNTNSFEDEPWVPKYEKRNTIRKVFDRQVWVQEPALRQIQDTIFVQSLIAAAVLSCIIVGIFCAIPRGNRF